MTLEAYFWVFVALLVGFNLGAWVEGSDEPESVEIVEQVCVDTLSFLDEVRLNKILYPDLSDDLLPGMKRDDI